MLLPSKKVYIIQTTKHSGFSLRQDSKLKKLKLKRITPTTFPNHYGRIELLDSNGYIIEDGLEKDDFYLVSNVDIPEDVAIHEDLVVHLGTYTCIDARTQEIDNKHVIILKDEFTLFPSYKIITELDNIRSFLISLRGPFKVTGFVASVDLPQPIKRMFDQIDWTNHSYWPASFEDSMASNYRY